MRQRTTAVGEALLLFILSFIICTHPVFSQENCFNGIDDDGDGLVDLNDPDGCDCEGTSQDLVVNGDFEAYECCPSNASQFDCATGWHTPNQGTTDYYNTCDWNGGGSPVIPPPPPPYPSGNGSAGFHIREQPPDHYREYVTQCLASPLNAGSTYTLMFDLSGAAHGSFQNGGNDIQESDFLELGLYATTSCPNTWGTIECPPSSSYDLILDADLTVPTNGTWATFTLTFVPGSNYTGIALGGRCNVTIQEIHYWWIDNISILSTGSINDPSFTVDGNSCLGLNFNADQDTFDTYQWFINGVAVQGANDLDFSLPPDSLPEVVLGVMKNGVCAFSMPFDTFPEPPISLDLTYDSIDCFGGTTTVDLFVDPSGTYTFQWSNGENSQSNQVGAGTHSVTVTNVDNGCTKDTFLTLSEPPPLTGEITVEVPVNPASGTGLASVQGFGGSSPYTYLWSDGTTGPIHDMVSPGHYTVTITDANGCQKDVYILVPAPELILNVVHTDPVCADSCNGSAVAVVNGGIQPYSYNWSNGDTDSIAYDLCAGNYTVEITDDQGTSINASIELLDPDPLIINGIVEDIHCSQAGSISIDLQNGEIPISFLWSNGDTTANIQVNEAGTYALTVTDENGCQAIDSFQLTTSAALKYSLNIDSITCLNPLGQIEVAVDTGTPPYSIVWADGDSTFLRDSLAAGSYAFTITDDSSCMVDRTITLQEIPEITTKANITHIKCHGGTGTISIQAEGGRQPYTFSWSNGDDSAVVQNLQAGLHAVTVSDPNDCRAIDSFVLMQPPEFLSSFSTSNASCVQATDGSIAVSSSGGTPPYQYHINGMPSDTLTGLARGIYEIVTVDSNGCTRTDTVTISSDLVDIPYSLSMESPNCGLDNGSLRIETDTSLYEIQWSTGSSHPLIQDLPAGYYAFTLTDEQGCMLSDTILLSERNTVDVTSTAMDESCSGAEDGSIDIEATPPDSVSYQWSHGPTTPNVNMLAPGNYSLTVTDRSGCDTILMFEINDGNTIELSAAVDPALCFGDITNVTLSAETEGGGIKYSWRDGYTGDQRQIVTSGSYEVVATDQKGCGDTITLELEYPDRLEIDLVQMIQPNSQFGIEGLLEVEVSGGTPPYSYSWSNGDSGNLIDGLGPGEYTVITIDRNGCRTELTITLPKLNKPVEVYIPNAFSPNGDGVNYHWTVYTGTDEAVITTMEIYDRWGEKVFENHDIPVSQSRQGWDGYFRGRLMDPAVFVYRVVVHFPNGQVITRAGDVMLDR